MSNIRICALACILLFLLPPVGSASGKPAPAAAASSDWELVSELKTEATIAPGKHYAAWFDNTTSAFREYGYYTPLSAKARQALNSTPAWIRGDLERTFLELGAGMDRYADIILGTGDARLVDEMAFSIAHTSPDVLSNPSVNPAAFAENAASVYAADANLSYVRLVEKGDCTTAAYMNATGAEVELPMDVYYWYIVHPKITDEVPTFIDPASGQAAAPPTGKFWRDYLMNHNDSGYPLLRDALANVPRLWNGTVNSDANNGAVGVIIRWIKDVMSFTSDNERPVQPVRIYAKHIGRCGEHEDITCAAARAALIPCIGAEDLAEDHVWNEFYYDGRWVSWEPVNTMVDSPYTYAAWGKKFPAVNGWRGDDYVWQQTGIYTQYCTFRALVKDKSGAPVEGAAVWVGIEYSPDTRFRMISTWNSTDASGVAEFRLGRNNTIYARVDSEKLAGAPTTSAANTGANPFILAAGDTVKVITDAQPTVYNYTFTLANAVVPRKNGYSEAGALQGNYRLEMVLKGTGSEVKGKNVLVSSHYYSDSSPLSLYSFLASDDEYQRFNYSQGYSGWGFSNKTDVTSEIIVPDNGKWHVVVGSDAPATIQNVQITVRLYVKPYITASGPAALVSAGSEAVIRGTADAGDLAKVELSFDGGNAWNEAVYNRTGRTWSYTWNTSGLSSGNYTVLSRLVHAGGPTAALPVVVWIDSADPAVRMRTGGFLKGGGTVRLEGNASDNIGVAYIELEITGAREPGGWRKAVFSNGSGTWSFDWETWALGSGDYSVSVRATDLAGRTGHFSSNLTLDFNAPTVSFTTTGLFRGGQTVLLEGTVTDDLRLDYVLMTGIGNASRAMVDGGRWHFDWDTTGLASGKYSLTATAADMAGWNSSASAAMILDSDAPRIDVEWLETAEAGGLVTIEGSVRDARGLGVVEICTDGENWTEVSPDEQGDWVALWDTSSLMPGNFSLSVRASDSVGNLAQVTKAVRLVDTTPPAITLDMPKDVEGGDVLVIKVKVQERTGIQMVELSTDGKEWRELTAGSKGYSAEIDTTTLSLGRNRIRVRAFDLAGSMGDVEREVTVNDDRAPAVTIENLDVEKQGLRAGGRASDNYRLRSLEYTVDGARWNALDAANGSWNLTLAKLSPGKYSLKMRATDMTGGTAETSKDFEIAAPKTSQKGFLPGFESTLAILSLLGASAVAFFVGGRRKTAN